MGHFKVVAEMERKWLSIDFPALLVNMEFDTSG
jgi:hypothetical protein